MSQTPGVILPASYQSQEELKKDVKRRDDEAGFSPLNGEDFSHSSILESGEDFIEHYGKKGMKWGVRKSRSRVKVSSDFKKTATSRNRKPHELTNKQLQEVNNRLNLEQNYKRLNPSKIQKGEAVAKRSLQLIGTATAVAALANSSTGRSLISNGRKAIVAATLSASLRKKL